MSPSKGARSSMMVAKASLQKTSGGFATARTHSPMTRAVELRILKLEARSPAPPSSFDHMISDQLRVYLLETYPEIFPDRTDRGGMSTIEMQQLRNWHQAIVDDITLTVELRSGIRPYPVPWASYAERVAKAAERWAALGGKSVYVPALAHGDTGAGEYDGFGHLRPLVPDLMERRAVLWERPVVTKIVTHVSRGDLNEQS
jgi:hypothetical protein